MMTHIMDSDAETYTECGLFLKMIHCNLMLFVKKIQNDQITRATFLER